MFWSTRSFGVIEDPGPPLRIRIGGRERPVLTTLLGFVLVPLKRFRTYRRQRRINRELDRIAALVERELPKGAPDAEFKARVFDRMHEWLRDNPPKS